MGQRHPLPLASPTQPRSPPSIPPLPPPAQSVDHSLFAKAVGTIKFTRFTERLEGRPPRDVRLVSVLPLQGDYSPGYREKAAAIVAARSAHRRRLLGMRAKYG
jgi:hypothetical protein